MPRYADYGDSPPTIVVCGSPVSPGFRATSARWTGGMVTGDRPPRTERRAAKSGFRLLAGHVRHVGGHVVGVRALKQARGHAPLARAAAPDRVEDALLVEPERVEVGARHAARVDRVEVVAARAGLAEGHLAVLELRAETVLAKLALAALRLAAVGDHRDRHGDAEDHVQKGNAEPEEAASAREIGLASGARPA